MGKKIYVIDDEPDMTMFTQLLLERKGYEVVVSSDSEAGLKDLLETPVDGVIMDLMMPGMTGFSLIERLRASERHKTTPIIVLSAKRLSDDERKGMIEKSVTFVPKPVTPKRLVEIAQDAF